MELLISNICICKY